MNHTRLWWTGLTAVALLATAEWLRATAIAWPVLVSVTAVAGVGLAARRRDPVGGVVAAILTGLTVLLALAQADVHRLQEGWPAERDRRIESVRSRLGRQLRQARERTEAIATQGVRLAAVDRRQAFQRLRDLVATDGPERAVAILERTGVPWAWAGRHRLAPRTEGDSIAIRFSPFYTTLEARRTGPEGRVIVATTLLWADSAAPRPDRSLTAILGQRAGVQLRVFPAGLAPTTGDLLDYTEPTTAGDRVLFTVQVDTPDQASAMQGLLGEESARLAGAWLILFLVGVAVAGGAGPRFTLLAILLWSVSRAPLGDAVGLGDLFSPATFNRSFLGPFSRSAGDLLVTALVANLVAIWLWRRRLHPTRARLGLAVLFVVGAPYLVSALGRGITPPLNGVATALWLTWQLTLAMATSAVLLLAAALFHGREAERSAAQVWLGALLAVAAALLGLVLWVPRLGWPGWYTFLWVPPLLLVTRPAPRWVTLSGTAIVAGAAAGLVTWGAELNARVQAAQRDLGRLGDVEDPLAVPLLERFGDEVLRAPVPQTPSQMFVLWRASDLAGLEYPVRLDLWSAAGVRQSSLGLDSLDLPAPLLAALVRGMEPGQARQTATLIRVPGRIHVLLQRLQDSTVLSTAIGPRTRLAGPSRLARLLRPPPAGAPLYQTGLGPPLTGLTNLPEVQTSLRREGWRVRSERLLDLPGGVRHAHADVTLGEPPGLVIRGTLLIALDVLVLLLFWGVSQFNWEAVRHLPVRRAARAFQTRLALVLGLFFVVPAAGFTAWSLSRLQDEAESRRDLLIAQALRDAVLTAGGLLHGTDEFLNEGLTELANRLQAELVLYSGGRLAATSAPILEQLALVDPLLDNQTFQRLVLGDELELLRNGTTYVAPVRVGYRVVQAGPPGGVGILATPQLSIEQTRGEGRHDLALGLLFATLVGGLGAVGAAQLVARFLSRPVADLQRLAVAFGAGNPVPTHRAPPVEFESVFGAFERMADDIKTSQDALERARRRTAAVLANVATAVIALDADGRVLLANARARQLLGADLPDGAFLEGVLGGEWGGLMAVTKGFLRGRQQDDVHELECLGRQIRVQLASLGESPGGAVLALDDLTDTTRAARVLAWGEMARQVAHEIKNPLTPIRLGMQHLQRVRKERPSEFDATFEATATRILGEISRLDTIARAFSRFGLPAGEQSPLESVDLMGAAREVAALYQMAEDGAAITVSGSETTRCLARRDEVKEVLGNLVENARNVGARRIEIEIGSDGLEVRDNGPGIPPEFLLRIFEPRFSTTTSGAGLGLPIVRRLVEGWGATIKVESAVGRGTLVRVWWAREGGPSGSI